MTIRSAINAQKLNNEWSNFKQCADEAPDGTYEACKDIAAVVDGAAKELFDKTKLLGLKANTCDGIREVEAVIYGFIKDSNPDSPVFPTSEGFGEGLQGPARERILAQAASNRDFLARAYADTKAAADRAS